MTLRLMPPLAVILTLPLLGCDAPARLGAARQQFCFGPAITNVLVDPVLYHWEDPDHLLEAAEGFGPRTVGLDVAVSVSPTVTVVITRTPSSGTSGGGAGGSDSAGEMLKLLGDATLSTSLGYSESQVFTLDASSSVLVGVNEYARLEAYTDFQRSTWNVVGPGCLGAGVSYKPVGVYFKTCTVLAGCPFVTGPTSVAPSPVGADAGAPGDAGGDGG
jgi:hypothetical protein